MTRNFYVCILCGAAYNSVMRRLFAILLLVLVPMQLSLAAVSEYCHDDQSRGARHPGHHEHAIADAHHDGENSHAPVPAGDLHNDCGFCHLGCAAAVLTSPAASIIEAAVMLHDQERHLAHGAPVFLPERPNWASLA
jgi:hypothetical protein